MTAQSALYNLLHRPVVTEKATSLAAYNQYVFIVDKDANKIELAKAFELAFPGKKVKSVKLINILPQRKRVGKSVGKTKAERKAIFRVDGEIELFNQA